MQAGAALVQLRHFQRHAQLHIAGVGLKLAGQHLQQGGLARAIGPDNADAVAAMDAQAEIADDAFVAEALGNALGVDHLGAGGLALPPPPSSRCPAASIPRGGPGAARSRRPSRPWLRLRRAADAMRHPVQLPRDLAVALVALDLFLLHQGITPVFKGPRSPAPAVWSGRDPATPRRGTDFPESAGHG